MVKKGRVLAPHADYCLPCITRATVMELVVSENIVLEERRISLSEFHAADEVVKVDGRMVGDGKVGPLTRQLQAAYKNLTDTSGVPIPQPSTTHTFYEEATTCTPSTMLYHHLMDTTLT
ncbi:hypothetical protein MLD38_035904 [Melastoma candidum]|uniref:Uncharacterized protein n=1 Tax=Melastoma candidum TaxID=119954 RepID=A0ACB9LIA4_9MYRT|nr:hypothetical protein MLD38_035904 [Melastoma candidum]